jgi:CDP-glycerol glycerophosphotransferase (TagB/SpsB family)/GT2 family glycosyltransferase
MKSDNPVISIILPCHNSENVISETISGIKKQNFRNFELVCVDDASTDSTLEILEQWKEYDDRIKLISLPENVGLGGARNIGIQKSCGKYIAFIDDDDFYEPDFLARMYSTIVNNDADLVQCNIHYVFNNRDYNWGGPAGMLSGEQAKCRIDVFDGFPYLTPQAWNKLYKKELFENIKYENVYYEDAEILPRLISNVDKIVFIDDALYHYNKRYSIITGSEKKSVESIKKFMNSLISMFYSFNEPTFDARMKAWNAKSLTPVANIRNVLNMIISKYNEYDYKERREIIYIVNEFFHSIEKEKSDLYGVDFFQLKRYFYEKFSGRFHSRISSFVKKIHPNFNRIYLAGLEAIFPLLDRIVPKNKALYVYSSWGKYDQHTLDNPRMMFEYMKKNDAIKNVVLLNSKENNAKTEKKNTKFYRLQTFKGFLTLLRAGKIFTGYSLHNIWGYRKLCINDNRKIIQLWHGIPVKKVGLMVSKYEKHWVAESKRYDLIVSSSEQDKSIMDESFILEPEKSRIHSIITGLPRHDVLFGDDSQLPVDYQRFILDVKLRLNGRKLILFAPTWRYNSEKPCMFSNEEFIAIEKFCRENSYVFGLRLHPSMIKKGMALPNILSDSIICLNDVPEANILLRLADVLVTDYSSIYLDFILLGRPIVLYTEDIDLYTSRRGFNYSYDEFRPHINEIKCFDDFIEYLKLVSFGKYKPDQKYNEVLNRFHKYPLDGKVCQRISEYCESDL